MHARDAEFDTLMVELRCLHADERHVEADVLREHMMDLMAEKSREAIANRKKTAREVKIDRLWDKLNRLHCHDNVETAKPVAEALAKLLGKPTPKNVRSHPSAWTLIWDVRGKIEKAIRVEEEGIVRQRASIEAGGYERHPKLLRDNVECLQISLEMQAKRYLKAAKKRKALDCVREIFELAEKFMVAPNVDMQTLYAQLVG